MSKSEDKINVNFIIQIQTCMLIKLSFNVETHAFNFKKKYYCG